MTSTTINTDIKEDYDDMGVLCRYTEEDGWYAIEDHCVTCGYRCDECECDDGEEDWVYPCGECGRHIGQEECKCDDGRLAMTTPKSENELFALTEGSGVPATMNTTTTTMATNKHLTFKMTFTVTKHYELKEKVTFDEFKERYFKGTQLPYAQAVWDRLQANKKGVVRLPDEDEDEEEDDENGDYIDAIQDGINNLVDELTQQAEHCEQCDECAKYYPRSEMKEDRTTFDKVAWWCKKCTASWSK